MDFGAIELSGLHWNRLAQDREKWNDFVNVANSINFHKELGISMVVI